MGGGGAHAQGPNGVLLPGDPVQQVPGPLASQPFLKAAACACEARALQKLFRIEKPEGRFVRQPLVEKVFYIVKLTFAFC